MLKFLKKSTPKNSSDSTQSIEKPGFFARLKQGLKRTHALLVTDITDIFSSSRKIDAALLDELEMRLLTADVGINVTTKIIDSLKVRLKRQENITGELVLATVKQQLCEILLPCEQTLQTRTAQNPFVILFVGINGSGKTTTIGKLAKQLQTEGKKVMLAAGDTFRAAAIEQLQVWGERNSVPVIAQQTGSDSAAVLFDALQSAKSRNIDVLIADTAGRLHTQSNLMDELKKIKRTLQKIDPNAPHEVLLVLDATTGQNALNQATQFHEAIGVSGLCITKLDGTAKGGIIFAIAEKLKLPIRLIGIGESIEDLRPFVAQDFVEALFAE